MTAVDRSSVTAALRTAMKTAGFVRHAASVYTLDMENGFFGWASLALSRSEDGFHAVVKVGVGHDGVDRLVTAASDPRPSRRSPAVSKYLGYLMPQNSALLGWEFSPGVDHDRVAQRVVVTMLRHGRPYMNAHADLEQLVAVLKSTVPSEYSQTRIPAALVCLGRPDEALAFIEAERNQLLERSDPAAEHFRRFAERFPAAIDRQ